MTHAVSPTDAVTDADRAIVQALEKTWADPPGFRGWLTTTDHRRIGKRYIITAFVFFVLGGLNAGLMRLQLSQPDNAFLNADRYNQIFTVHGTTMMFLFAVPMMTALGIYFVPMMVGARDVAFPRLNAYGYWTYLIGGILLYAGLLTNTGPDAGWFNYAPLAGPGFSPGKRIDIWSQTVTFTEIAALIGAMQILVTTFKMRAPGMTLARLPLFVWAQVVTSVMIIFAMPWVATASLFMASDRLIGTHLFNPAEGGHVLLWQHLFWFFGHPEVYIIFMPSLGMVSQLVITFTGRPVFGYTAIVVSMIAQGFLAFGLWVHHMFTTSVPGLASSFFTATSALIALPTGVQIFCWIATIWMGRPRLLTPFLCVLGFVGIFMIGGLSGVMIASVPFDSQVHDTYFIVAHLHYVLLGAVFPVFGVFYYWFPKVTGRMLSERLGRWHVALFFTGINVTFFPMHFLGLAGMPRRVYTYLAETGWGRLNLVASLGAVIIVASAVVFLVNVVRSLRQGAPAGDNPWNADSLEWATSSPPPPYGFVHPPVVEGRAALWDRSADAPVVHGLRSDVREVLVTTLADALPDSRRAMPEPTIWPFLAALATGVMFISLVFTEWGLVIGTVLLAPPLIRWAWPTSKAHEDQIRQEEFAL